MFLALPGPEFLFNSIIKHSNEVFFSIFLSNSTELSDEQSSTITTSKDLKVCCSSFSMHRGIYISALKQGIITLISGLIHNPLQELQKQF